LLAVGVGIVCVSLQSWSDLPVGIQLQTIDFRIADVEILGHFFSFITVVNTLLRGSCGADGVVADLVFKFGEKRGGIQRQCILLPVDAQLGVDALLWLQVIVTDPDI
jgi:hypothetical protein